MSWALRKTDKALDDLADIWAYVAADNVAAADKLVDDMLRSFDRTADHPMMGRSADDIAPDFRVLTRGRYLLWYRVIEDERAVELVRVLHGARDIAAILEQGGLE